MNGSCDHEKGMITHRQDKIPDYNSGRGASGAIPE